MGLTLCLSAVLVGVAAHATTATTASAAATTTTSGDGGGLHNVLMITVDDLRPQLTKAYGMNMTITPNIDKLSEGGMVFHRAYCQQAVCSPSRNSFMSGRRPDTTKVWNFINHFREVGPNWKALPQWFKEQGYIALASGKLYHPAHPPGDDYPTSWTTEADINPYYWGNQAPIGDADGCSEGTVTFPLKEKFQNTLTCLNADPEAMGNNDNKSTPQAKSRIEYAHRLATRTIEFLQYAKSRQNHFYIGVGIRKPHLPWRVPTQFWDMYEGINLTTAKHQTIGDNITTLAFERNGGPGYDGTYEGKSFGESPNGELGALPQELQSQLRRGYYAAVSFMDHEVGRILDGLDSLGLTDNTAVLLHADHGWKLGEHGDWSKCTNWELDARVPFIIRAPWITTSVGRRTWQFAELIDIYPTLVDLAGLPLPPASEGLEGTSLVPVLHAPNATATKTMAFSQYPRCPEYSMYTDYKDYECLFIPAENFTVMGFSVRVADARYTEWRKWKPTKVGDWTSEGLIAQELYDHTGDVGYGAETFDDYEYVNLAYKPANATRVQELALVLANQFQHD